MLWPTKIREEQCFAVPCCPRSALPSRRLRLRRRLAESPDQGRDPLPARRADRHHDTHRHGEGRPAARPADAVRQQRRRLGHDRRGLRQDPAGRRLQFPGDDGRHARHHAPPAADPVRSGQGFPHRGAHVDLVGLPRHPSLGAGQHHGRVRGLRESQPRQDQLRLVGQRHHHASLWRDAESRGRHQDDARALQGQRAGDAGPAGRPDTGADRPDLPAAHPGRTAARAGDRRRQALARQARHPDAARKPATARRAARAGTACWRPAGTPTEIVDKMAKAIDEAMQVARRARQARQGRRQADLSRPGRHARDGRRRKAPCMPTSSSAATCTSSADGP